MSSKKTEERKCLKCKKSKTKSPRSKWCYPCYKERRTKQLADNNVVWRERVAKGKAGHHVRYRNRPTVWAAEHTTKALQLAKKYKTAKDEALTVLEKVIASKPKKAAKKAEASA